MSKKFTFIMELEVEFDRYYRNLNGVKSAAVYVHLNSSTQGVEKLNWTYEWDGICKVSKKGKVSLDLPGIPDSIEKKVRELYTSKEIIEIFDNMEEK